MITGIENFGSSLQKAILNCIATLFDVSEDIEVEEVKDHIIKIDDIQYYIITEDDQQRILTDHNSAIFMEEFDGLSDYQLEYVDRDKWIEDNGVETFQEWLEDVIGYTVRDVDYYGGFNFYEIQ